MQFQETVLFVCVVVLAAALVTVLVAPRLRGGKRGTTRAARPGPGADPRAPAAGFAERAAAAPGADPGFSSGATARAGAPAVALTPPPPVPIAQMLCPTCRRRYATGLRYCPYDARVLTADFQHTDGAVSPTASGANAGKICPSCSRRYDTVAVVCGRDGTALVSVN